MREFVHKPGSFTLFKNIKKTSDKAPDYRGEGKDLDGTSIEVAAWIKDGAKGKFMSCLMQTPREGRATRPEPKEDDTLPF